MTEDQVREALDFVLDLEGGQLTRDAGGLTRWGVSSNAHPEVNIVELTRPEAAAIYLRDYWAPHRLGEIENVTIASRCLSIIVNRPPRLAVQVIQAATNRALGELSAHDHDRGKRSWTQPWRKKPEMLDVDGILGSLTLEAINCFAWRAKDWLWAFRAEYAYHLAVLRAGVAVAEDDPLLRGLLWRSAA